MCYGLWNPPTASFPNCISALAGLPVGRKHSVFNFISFPVGVVSRATCVCIKSEEEEGGPGEKTLSNIWYLGCNT